jgi:hypothetical protein
MLAEMVLPNVVDVGAGCQFLTRHLGLVVGVAVGGRLAFLVLRLALRDLSRSRWEARHRDLVDAADMAEAYDLEDAGDRRAAARRFYQSRRRRRTHERK